MHPVLAILRKDLVEFSRERIYLVLSVAGLALFIAVYWISPDTAGAGITVGVHVSDSPMLTLALDEAENDEGIQLVRFDSAEDLRGVIAGRLEAWVRSDGGTVVRDRDAGDPRPGNARRVSPVIGISFRGGTMVADGEAITLFTNDTTPREIRGAMESMLGELSLTLAGEPLPVTLPPEDEIILGPDRLGMQVPMRERMRPLLAYFVLMMETFALASLIASEISQRTVLAIIATPAKLSHILTAKALHGIALAATQAIVLLAAIGSFRTDNWFVLILVSLLGAGMFTGVAMVVGSAGRDFIENLFLTVALVIPLAIPAFSALFPGLGAAWVRFVPSYGIMQILTEVTVYGTGIQELMVPLLSALAWVAGIFVLGILVLSKKVRSL